MDNISNNFIEISDDRELLEIDGGLVTIGLYVGIVAGVAAILDYGYAFGKGAVKGYNDHIK